VNKDEYKRLMAAEDCITLYMKGDAGCDCRACVAGREYMEAYMVPPDEADEVSTEELEAASDILAKQFQEEFVADFNDHEFHRQEAAAAWDDDTRMHYRQDYPPNCDL
jgi:hypothetical protein